MPWSQCSSGCRAGLRVRKRGSAQKPSKEKDVCKTTIFSVLLFLPRFLDPPPVSPRRRCWEGARGDKYPPLLVRDANQARSPVYEQDQCQERGMFRG